MALEKKVPSPGESITEVEIAQWLVQDGDYVEKDQAIAEVDSDKATLELPAEASGIITLKAQEGDAVAVGEVVCLIDTAPSSPTPVKRKTETSLITMTITKSVLNAISAPMGSRRKSIVIEPRIGAMPPATAVVVSAVPK